MAKFEAVKKYGTAKYLHDALPNATYIGFTGTPVETKDHSTTNVFGEIIDVYDMTQAIEDGSTVPILYEARMAKVGLNEKILQAIDAYYKSLEDEEKADEEGPSRPLCCAGRAAGGNRFGPSLISVKETAPPAMNRTPSRGQ